MDKINKTKLDHHQLLRLINYIDSNKEVRNAYLCVVKDTCVKKIAINYEDGDKESFYPMEDDLDYILNGIALTRNKPTK